MVIFFVHCNSLKWHREVLAHSGHFHLLHFQLHENQTRKWALVRNRAVFLIFLQNICSSRKQHCFLSKIGGGLPASYKYGSNVVLFSSGSPSGKYTQLLTVRVTWKKNHQQREWWWALCLLLYSHKYRSRSRNSTLMKTWSAGLQTGVIRRNSVVDVIKILKIYFDLKISLDINCISLQLELTLKH